MLHSSTYPGFKARTKSEMIEGLSNKSIPLNPLVEALVAIQRGEKQYMFTKVPYSELFDYIQAAKPQFWHEWLHGPVKMFFDLDLDNTRNNDESGFTVAHDFLKVLFSKMTPGADESAFLDFVASFTVLRRMRHPDALKGNKLSLHLIQNNGTHFASASSLKTFLAKFLDVEICRKFSVDMGVYKDGNFQTVGGVKWDEWGGVANPNREYYVDHFMPSFFPMGLEFGDFSFPLFLECMVQFIPAGSKLIGDSSISRVVNSIEYNGPGKSFVEAAIKAVQNLHEANSEAKISGIGHVSSAKAHIFLSGVSRCSHGEQLFEGTSILVSMEDQAAKLSCRCGTRPKILFLSDHSRMAFDFLTISLPIIMEKGYDRVDFPITFDELGGRALQEDFYTDLGFEQFYFHPPPLGTGPLYSLLIWRWITCAGGLPGICSDVIDMRLATTYVNLFFNLLQKRNQFVFRSVGSYLNYKANELKTTEMQKFTYLVEEEYGKPNKHGIRKTKMVEKKFYDYWVKNTYQRIFSDCRVGVFDFSPSSGFHDFPPAATNFTQCLREWQSLGEDAAIKQMVKALWMYYLVVITFLEDVTVVEVARGWIERWFLTILFNYGEKLFTTVWLVSAEQGTGKSTLPELICKALGSSLTLLVRDMPRFLNKQFNSEGNRGFVFFDDVETGDLSKADSGALRALVTNQTYSSSIKFGSEAYQVANIQNFCIAMNPKEGAFIPELGTKTERRYFAQEVPNSEKQQALFGAEPYICKPCRNDGLVQEGESCIHDFSTFPNFWCLMKKHVMGDSFEKRGDLFYLFFGFLMERYLELKKDWTTSLQTTLPICRAITSQQEVARPPAFEFLNISLNRGYHACPTGGAQDIFKNKVVDWPDDIPLEENSTSWLKCVPVSTLYATFKHDIDTQMKIKGFLTQFNQALVERLGVGFQETYVDCISYEYRSVGVDEDFMVMKEGKLVKDTRKVYSYRWTKLGGQSKPVKCLLLPSPRQEAPRGQFMLRMPTNLTTSFAPEVSISRVGLNVSRSNSCSSMGSYQPEEESLSGTPDPRNPRSALKRVLDEENACDEDFYEKRCRAEISRARDSPELDLMEISDREEEEEEEEVEPTFILREAEEVEEEEDPILSLSSN